MALNALILLGILLTAEASLIVKYPVNSQLPPVARVSQPYEFVFSQDTFGGDDSNIAYSLSNAPSWLHVDSKKRTLSGTPQKEDVGSPTFNLIAADRSGSTTMQVTLVVTKDSDGPKPGKSLYPQLHSMGPTSAPSRLIIRSGDSFSFSFDSETFANRRPSTVYYGTSSPNNAPLPSWIRFDQASLQFSGTTPDIGPQTFGFNLVASDVAGFSAATVSFEIVVSPHILSFNQSAETLFIARESEFRSPSFADTLTIDGRKPVDHELIETHVESPEWLSLDRKTLTLSGTPPPDVKNENVTISVRDTYQDVATLIVTLQYSRFFSQKVQGCEAIIGQYFTYVFNNSILINNSTELDAAPGEILPWLQYNRGNKTLYGQVPSDLDPHEVTIDITAREGTAEDTQAFTINIVAERSLDGLGTTSSMDSSSGKYQVKKADIIVMSIFIPVGLVSVILLLLYCRRCRQRRTTHEEGKGPDGGPLPPYPDAPGLSHSQPFETTTQGDAPMMGKPPSPSSKAPQLGLGPWWSAKNLNKPDHGQEVRNIAPKDNGFSTSTIEWDFAPLKSPEQDENKPPEGPLPNPDRSFQSSPSMNRRASNNSGRREPLRSIQPRRSLKRNSALSSQSKRYSKRSSGISTVSSGLPVRLSGAGHGAGGVGPPGHGAVRISWQNTHTSLQSDESSVGNLAPLFPRPPPRKRASQECSKRISLRAVDRDSLTISEADSLEAFVSCRAKSRNSSNPMFSGQISARRVSSGLRALERARSSASRADTMTSSIYVDDNCRQSIQEHPTSFPMSSSSYPNDNRNSTYLRLLSEESPNVELPGPTITKDISQLSLARNYSNLISQVPRCFSEISLQDIKQYEDGRACTRNGRPEYCCWPQSSSFLQNGAHTSRSRSFRKSPSASSILYDGKPRRASLAKLAEQESSYSRGFQGGLTSSVGSGLAFV